MYWKGNKPIVISEPDLDLVYDGFLAPCGATGNCSNGLVCDYNTYTCRLKEGSKCNNFSDCAFPGICSGVCVVSDYVGKLNNYCPCQEGYLCSEIPNTNLILGLSGSYLCKVAPNGKCGSNQDCYSQLCQNGKCSSKYPITYPCKNSQDCQDGWCSKGYCQIDNLITGAFGSACGDCDGISDRASCNSGYSCSCEYGESGESGKTGICQNNIFGFQQSCYYQGCNKNFTCTDEICGFNFNPNYSPNNNCITNMVKGGQTCLNTSALPCFADSNCSSGRCVLNTSGKMVKRLYKYSFYDSNGSPTGNYYDATSINLDLVTNFPNITTSNKMFSYTDSDNEYIFVYNSSPAVIYMLRTNLKTGSKVSKIIFNNNSPGTILTDAAYVGGDFLMVFNQNTIYKGNLDLNNFTITGITGYNMRSGDSRPYQYWINYNTGTYVRINGIIFIDISQKNQIRESGGDVLLTCVGKNFYIKAQNNTNFQIPTYFGGDGGLDFSNYSFGPLLFYNSDSINYVDGTRFDVSDTTNSNAINCAKFGEGENLISCSSAQNISYMGNIDKSINQNLVLFKGNLDRYQYPLTEGATYYVHNFSIYSETQTSFTKTIMITFKVDNKTNQGENVITVAFYNNFFDLPGYWDPSDCSVLATKNNLYVMTSSYCS